MSEGLKVIIAGLIAMAIIIPCGHFLSKWGKEMDEEEKDGENKQGGRND